MGTARAPRDIREDKGRDQNFFFKKKRWRTRHQRSPPASACGQGAWTATLPLLKMIVFSAFSSDSAAWVYIPE